VPVPGLDATFQSVYSNNVFFGCSERWFAVAGHGNRDRGVRVTYALLLKNFIASPCRSSWSLERSRWCGGTWYPSTQAALETFSGVEQLGRRD